MKIAFHCNQLSIRGTEVAMFDYAHYNEKLLGNESIILAKSPVIWKYSHPQAIEKFKKRFSVYFYEHVSHIEQILDENNIDIFYAQKAGMKDDVFSMKRKNVVHAVFQYEQPHGNVYAYISEWLSKLYGNRHPFVPYMVDLPDHNKNLRDELEIPSNAIVYGRHGGYETFDINYAKTAVVAAAKARPDIYFLFLNTDKFSDLKNIIYLPPNGDPYYKVKFINTCNAMLHARTGGESFGLAIGEFSIRNKPVITSTIGRDRAHYEFLGDKGIYYSTHEELVNILLNPEFLEKDVDWNCYKQFAPEIVMDKFEKVFIKN